MPKREFITTARFTKRVQYLESPEQYVAIEEYAREHGMTAGAVIRLMVRDGLKNGGKQS